MGFEYGEILKLRDGLVEAEKTFDEFLKPFLVKMGMMALRKTIMRTPVKTGRLKGGWDIGEVYTDGDVLCIDLINAVEYAWYVEEGHKWSLNGQSGWVNGRFMARISLLEVYRAVPSKFNTQFNKWLGGLING